ncbi:bifunctional tetrahydrofolate synthase/dihydrofolate synthase [Pollutimonas sp. M17]|uniref:bifunctional tetrahydrofolate synthase/dihydrofolate synthase n=1 Tax=Pollutimonas sp. M17 TaxID=2962065 RepID=UPI0021F4B405|nr:bifunctional tetrahydrofolate synthase/dihydrofolate synthase [Pollutimonas sp. M17]UYO95345.1 bifunctional tetrahydrofolate synthase/dihydrofolate synthase [Pollutimonas sp. M17]HWK70403.1 bifunctional tetrahydrofolate synthase/dihydrofolate synthase [Burkholderiaceae bacterium]
MPRPRPSDTATLQEWLDYLESLHRTPIDLGLDRIRAVAEKLKLELPFVKITVGGTNGKGSTCAMLEAILLASGYKVGTYTSPHLIDFNERIRVNGDQAGDADIIRQFREIEDTRGDTTLSYFEYTTLAALMLFEQQKVDVAVLEVGLGGRLDAVNLVDTDCAIITSVDIDHTAYLGDTREKIGWEKAHIFRAGRPAICADPMPPQTILDHAGEIGADLWLFGKDFNYSGDRQQWAYGGRSQRRSGLAYPSLRGANQLLNASAALAALEALRPRLVVPQQAVRIGLSQVSLPGRLQILPGTPTIILDVAHNPHAAAALGQNLDNMGYFPHTHAVVGMLNDKDIAGVIAKLAHRVDHWYCASLEGPRGTSGADLADAVRQAIAATTGKPTLEESSTEVRRAASTEGGRPGVRSVALPPVEARTVKVSSFENPVQAFTEARKQAAENDRILVFGSFATVGPVLDELGRKAT